jgi:serine protease 7 (enterokinase)/suppressor of tumorigenicity protein 14
MNLLAICGLLIISIVGLTSAAQINDPICGVQAKGNEPEGINSHKRYIVGGSHAKPHSWPWTALIMFNSAKRGEIADCGGALINKRWMVSAGHCFANFQPMIKRMSVKVGVDNHGHTDKPNEPSQQVVQIEKAIVHPKFNKTNAVWGGYDVSLVKFNKDVEFNDNVIPICLPSKDIANEKLNEGDDAIVVGWGLTSIEKGSVGSDTLQQVDLKVIGRDECGKRNGLARRHLKVHETKICAGSFKGEDVGNCKGDSGSPLVAKRNNHWELFGVVSGGLAKCSTARWPGVYTSIAHPEIIDWIHKTLETEH